MDTNEPPGDDSNGTETNPHETPVLSFIEEEVLSENPDLQTLLAVESENISGHTPRYLQYCSPRLHEEEDRVVQEVVDDSIAEQLLGEPPAKRSRYDDPGDSNVGPDSDSNHEIAMQDDPEPKKENSNLLEATAEKSMNVSRSTGLKLISETNGKHFLMKGTIDDPSANSNLVIIIKEDPEANVEYSNLVEVTSEKNRSTALKTDSQSVAATTDENCLVPDTNVGPIAESLLVIDITEDSEPNVEGGILNEATSIKITAQKIISPTNDEYGLVSDTTVDQCLKPKLPIDSKSLPRATAESCSSHTNLTAETGDLRSPVIKTIVVSSTQDEQSDTELLKTIENQRIFETAGTSGERRPSLGVRVDESIQSKPPFDIDSASDTTDGSHITNKRKIQMLEEADKYPDSIFKKPKFLGRDEKVPLGETASSSTSGKCCSDVSISEEDRDKENKKKVPGMEGPEPKELGVSVGDGSRQEGPAPDDRDEGLGEESDLSSGESDEGQEFALRRRPPTPPPRARGGHLRWRPPTPPLRARGAGRTARSPKYPDWFNHHRQDQF